MGLFSAKYCDVCGDKIKLLGNRKLEDGNLCKECASKLSPWFSERRSSTVQDIKAQLEYREENQEKVAAFNTTRSIGEYYMVMLDEDAKKFCVAQAKDIRKGNPDILDFKQVTGCDLDIDETKHEVFYEDAEGKQTSYDPARYDYSYDFYVQLRVNHPWFDEMRFKINPSSVDIEYGSTLPAAKVGGSARPAAAPGGQHPAPGAGQRPMPGQHPGAGQHSAPGQHPSSGQHPAPGAGQRPTPGGAQRPPMNAGVQNRAVTAPVTTTVAAYDPTTNAEYQRYVAMGNEIKEAIMQVRQDAREEAAAASAPKTAVICPACGASTIPNENGCCEYCGSAITV